MSCEIFKSDVVVAYADFYFLNNYVKIIVNENTIRNFISGAKK